MADIKIKKIRMLGGKIGSMFEEKNITTVKEAREFELNELEHIIGDDETAKWFHNLIRGVCFEKVEVKGPPKSASGIKTFNPIRTIKELEHNVTLCVFDVCLKM